MPTPTIFPQKYLNGLRIGLFAGALMPLIWLREVWNSAPLETLQRDTGICALSFLLLTLCITPLRSALHAPWLIRIRRMLGLFCFFYASLHALVFAGLDHAFSPLGIARALTRHPFVLPGMAAFFILLLLALSSSNTAVRKLGGRRWQELHRAIYPTAIAACLHALWGAEAEDLPFPLTASLLLGYLLVWRIRARREKAAPAHRLQEQQPIKFFPQKPAGK